MTTQTLAQRPRYDILDGLRGVAAILVILYHFGEGFATSPVDQWMNHGYLAVDFFFVLSGFVIGYAYDPRWRSGDMTPGRFMLRRVIRLQPMVVLSVILGAIAFLIQGSVKWDGTAVPLSAVAISLLLALFMIPALPLTTPEVRGNGEMFPLDGPQWSLFFEYIGSLLYALWLHRLSTKQLRIFVAASALGLAVCALCNLSGAYHIGFGWSAADLGWLGGFLRMSFSFSMGMLLTRDFRPHRVRGAFWICSAIIILILATPYIGAIDGQPSPLNALYDLACTFILFPTIVYIGACGNISDRISQHLCEFIGRLSYPIYIIHYPAMYLLYSWVWSNGISITDALPVCAIMLPALILAAWLALRYYDQPLRSLLSRRLLK